MTACHLGNDNWSSATHPLTPPTLGPFLSTGKATLSFSDLAGTTTHVVYILYPEI